MEGRGKVQNYIQLTTYFICELEEKSLLVPPSDKQVRMIIQLLLYIYSLVKSSKKSVEGEEKARYPAGG
jgi:hypothetical protein